MKNKKLNQSRKEDIVGRLNYLSKELKTKILKQTDWKNNIHDISLSTVIYHFGTWSEAVHAAGLDVADRAETARKKQTIDENILLADLLRVYKTYGKITYGCINSKSKYTASTYIKRFGSIPKAFEKAKIADNQGALEKEDTDEDVQKEIKIDLDKALSNTAIYQHKNIKKKSNHGRKKKIFSEEINFRSLQYAPINELGVIFLFGMVCKDLNYKVEKIQIEFPDCLAKRLINKTNQMEEVHIEFEYKSQNFVDHGHDPKECDVLVCWEHNWKECPENIEVIELKKTIQLLQNT